MLSGCLERSLKNCIVREERISSYSVRFGQVYQGMTWEFTALQKSFGAKALPTSINHEVLYNFETLIFNLWRRH
jgi:hypothetical protein